MAQKIYNCLLISDFNIDNLAGYLNNSQGLPQIRCTAAAFNQVTQILIDKSSKYWKELLDLVVIWTRPDNTIASFKRLLNQGDVTAADILEEVDEFSNLLLTANGIARTVLVPMWVFPTCDRGLGLLDIKADIGIRNILMQMNLRLSQNLSKSSSTYILNTQRWVEMVGQEAFNSKSWYMGKIAFGNKVFMESARDIRSAIKTIEGLSRKLIILDLDDTLWGGIVADTGWENIKLGGHDFSGEAYVDFQLALKSLARRGILLAIVSKNDEAIALEAIDRHPEMVLKREDFAGWRINWQDKAQNIVDLVSGLNLGLQSAVFIDDNPFERSRVKEALPEVFVPEWPASEMLYKSALLNLDCFDTVLVSGEDTKRTKMYAAEQQRRDLKNKVSSLEEWLKTLDMVIKIEELNRANIQRTAQLLNKTNQMNLSTRRMTESELEGWARGPGRKVWTFCVYDRFGDSGLTGIISLEAGQKRADITDFVMSCRVIGRKIEEVMLHTAIRYAKSMQIDKVYARYIPTTKNGPCLDFLKNSGMKGNSDGVFIWESKKEHKAPAYIMIEGL